MPKANLIFHRKRHYDDGSISEMKLWQVPASVRGSGHHYKYSLFYGASGERWVGYDNEAGKGDHRHYGAAEHVYRFTNPQQLVADFMNDVSAERARRKGMKDD